MRVSVAASLRARIRGRLRRAFQPRAHRIVLNDLITQTTNFAYVTWLGYPVWQNVLDLWALQEAIAEMKPSLLIETGTFMGGSARFFASLFDLMGEGHVITVDTQKLHEFEHPRITFLIGSSISEEVLETMRARAREAAGPVMVVLDSDHSRDHVARELEAYAPLVTPGSLMLVEDGIVDELERFREFRPGPLQAIESFLRRHPEFHVDERYDRRFLLTYHPGGWLRRRDTMRAKAEP